jgi:uncharacterized protein (DUF1800 family)
MPVYPPIPAYPNKADKVAKGSVEQADRRPDARADQVVAAALVTVHEPIHENLTLVWHNHFATSAAKVKYVR